MDILGGTAILLAVIYIVSLPKTKHDLNQRNTMRILGWLGVGMVASIAVWFNYHPATMAGMEQTGAVFVALIGVYLISSWAKY